jgi:hypothetical protein
MKNIFDVLRQKEAELQQIQKEVEALRVAARLLSDESEARAEAVVRPPAPTLPGPIAAPRAKEVATGFDTSPRQFP